jgi:hypothetical protein
MSLGHDKTSVTAHVSLIHAGHVRMRSAFCAHVAHHAILQCNLVRHRVRRKLAWIIRLWPAHACLMHVTNHKLPHDVLILEHSLRGKTGLKLGEVSTSCITMQRLQLS